MKNTFLLFSIIVTLIITTMFSCRPKENTPHENLVRFDTLHSSNNYYINNDSTQPSCNLKLTFAYPISKDNSNKESLDSLQQLFISCFFDETYIGLTPNEAIKNYQANYIESYKEDYNFFSQDLDRHDSAEVFSSYYEIDKNEIKFNKSDIISLQVTKTNYKGGATSYDLIKNYNIDLNTLQLIDENDIFNEGYEKALNSIFREELLKNKNVRSLSELEDMGFFGLDEMLPNGNFLLDEKGITYTFNKGEYSSLKTDPITIFIAYNDITPLIKENSPVSKFIPS